MPRPPSIFDANRGPFSACAWDRCFKFFAFSGSLDPSLKMKNTQERPVSPGPVFSISNKLHRISLSSTKPSNALPLLSFSSYIMNDPDIEEHRRHLTFIDTSARLDGDPEPQEMRSTPLFTSRVRSAIKNREVGLERLREPADIFPQYGLLGLHQCTYNYEGRRASTFSTEENLVYTNMNEPWSAFICGSQGGGKSHTLSCLLENCLLSHSPVGVLPNPLAGIVFHYDKFTSATTTQLCEAAYLCSSGVPVRVLVSPSNYHNMVRLYSNLPGLSPHVRPPRVVPLYLQEQQLNASNMLSLMAASDGSKSAPLYLDVLVQILRDMAVEREGRAGVDYAEFKSRLDSADFSRDQNGPLRLRLQLLESFLDPRMGRSTGANTIPSSNVWRFEQGSLTIVDLSDPFVNENDACSLFSICLSLFMESRGKGGKIVALDEAHKVDHSHLQSDHTNLSSFLRNPARP